MFIFGNLIGTDLTGALNLGNQGIGIQITNTSGVVIDSNVIAFNECCQLGGQPGVLINSGSNPLISNSIFSNQALGIDLAPVGVNPNNTVANANNGQNSPVITAATSGGGSTHIQGTLDTDANTIYSIQFFGNTACDPSGHGEGQTFLGQTPVLTDGSGHATFDVTYNVNASAITSTATCEIGGVLTDTSEFSACFNAATLLAPVITKSFLGSRIQAGDLSQVDLRFTIHNPNTSDPQDPTFNRLTGVGFTDTLPGGLVVFTPNGLVSSCGGVTATAGSTSIGMSGGYDRRRADLPDRRHDRRADRHGARAEAQCHEQCHVERGGRRKLGGVGHYRAVAVGLPAPSLQAIRCAEHSPRRHDEPEIHHHEPQSERPDRRSHQRHAAVRARRRRAK
jgi:hypothetical protein